MRLKIRRQNSRYALSQRLTSSSKGTSTSRPCAEGLRICSQAPTKSIVSWLLTFVICRRHEPGFADFNRETAPNARVLVLSLRSDCEMSVSRRAISSSNLGSGTPQSVYSRLSRLSIATARARAFDSIVWALAGGLGERLRKWGDTVVQC